MMSRDERHLEQRLRRHFVWSSLRIALFFGRIFRNEHGVVRKTARMGAGLRRATLRGIAHSKAVIANVKCRVYRHDVVDKPGPVFIYLHGGGWTICSARSYHSFTLGLCRDTGATVVSVDYRLAPEHPFPAGQDDCLAVARAILKADSAPDDLPEELRGIVDVTRVVIGGDSAGGNLSVAVALDMIRAGDDRRLYAIMSISPAFQIAWSSFESLRKYANTYMATSVGWFLSRYAGVGFGDKRVERLIDEGRHVDETTKQYLFNKYMTLTDDKEAILPPPPPPHGVRLVDGVPEAVTRLATNVRAWPLLAEDSELAQICSQDFLFDEERLFIDRMRRAGARDVRCDYIPRAQHAEAIMGEHFHSKASRLAYSHIIATFKCFK